MADHLKAVRRSAHYSDAMRLVLDTNVWLDWLVFQDPRLGPLTHAIEHGAAHIIATEAMLAEFDAVIARPWFNLDADAVDALSGRIRSHVHAALPAPDCRLPCTDPADQKFIDLAVAQRVQWLLSRDKALLRLARLAGKRFALRIGTPEHWVSAQQPLLQRADLPVQRAPMQTVNDTHPIERSPYNAAPQPNEPT